MHKPPFSFTFFGTSEFSVFVLDALKEQGLVPAHIVTTPDKPQGRKLIITPPPVKVWAQEHNVPYIQPTSLRPGKNIDPETMNTDVRELLKGFESDVFIVASYGKIIPDDILNIPVHKTLNVHPSLLPRLRGASPLQSAILNENETGVTIIRLDAEMDHGPIVAQEKVEITPWPPHYHTLEKTLAVRGGHLLASILPDWINGSISEREQDHAAATYTEKIEKTDGELDLSGDPQKNLRKIRAFQHWPGTYFFVERSRASTQTESPTIRVIIKDAQLASDGTLEILRVIPEGKKEMDYRDFLKGL